MCPDVEAYAPLVAASFGMTDEPGGHPAARLRVKLADRSLRQTNPLLRPAVPVARTRRADASPRPQLLDLAGAAPGARAGSASTATTSSGCAAGRSTPARAGASTPRTARRTGSTRIAQGTWRAALDRLLLGVAMEDDVAWVGDTAAARRRRQRRHRPRRPVRRTRRPRRPRRRDAAPGRTPCREWMRLLARRPSTLGEPRPAWQAMQLRRELDEVAEDAGDTDVRLTLADVTALLHARLAGRPTRASFRTGTLTVCTLVPMRSVPHRVVCLLGMDDGAFPRQGVADGDDVLARDPRTGERDIRSEDRQLFLDAICAAQEHLIITYTGADPRSGAEVPPCVPLGELLDAIDATALGGGREQVVVHHPLQPFDRAQLHARRARRGRAVLASTRSALAGARAAARHPRRRCRRSSAAPLPAPAAATVGLDELDPVPPAPGAGIPAAAPGDQHLRPATTIRTTRCPSSWTGCRTGRSATGCCSTAWPARRPRRAARLEYLRGELPPGPLGTRRPARRSAARVDALLHACEAEREIAGRSLDVAIPLAGGRVLSGTVSGVRGTTHPRRRRTRRLAAKHRITAWVRYLAALAQHGRPALAGGHRRPAPRRRAAGRSCRASRRISRGRCWRCSCAIRDAGLREPLPLALETSADVRRPAARGDVGADSLPARVQALGGRPVPPERDEPEHVLAFGAEAAVRRADRRRARGRRGIPRTRQRDSASLAPARCGRRCWPSRRAFGHDRRRSTCSARCRRARPSSKRARARARRSPSPASSRATSPRASRASTNCSSSPSAAPPRRNCATACASGWCARATGWPTRRRRAPATTNCSVISPPAPTPRCASGSSDSRVALRVLRRRHGRRPRTSSASRCSSGSARPATSTPAPCSSRTSTTSSLEVVQDLYLRKWGRADAEPPQLSFKDALALAAHRRPGRPGGAGPGRRRRRARHPAALRDAPSARRSTGASACAASSASTTC